MSGIIKVDIVKTAINQCRHAECKVVNVYVQIGNKWVDILKDKKASKEYLNRLK